MPLAGEGGQVPPVEEPRRTRHTARASLPLLPTPAPVSQRCEEEPGRLALAACAVPPSGCRAASAAVTRLCREGGLTGQMEPAFFGR